MTNLDLTSEYRYIISNEYVIELRRIIESVVRFNYKNFLNRKNYMLAKLNDAIKKGEVDKYIIPHLNLLNSMYFCFTTSSCSGRILLIDAPLIGPKYESKKVRIWHQLADYEEVKASIENYEPKNILWLKFDSFIIAFSVASMEWAEFFLKAARLLNLKDSGIRSINPRAGFINMDLTSTEKMHLPVRTRNDILVDDNYLRNVVIIANFMMQKNLLKLDMLRHTLEILHSWLGNNNSPPPLDILKPAISEYRTALTELERRQEDLLRTLQSYRG
ncbi:MAG: hypothetical protein NDP09_01985 [Crenarchaeota archaeon]|nr:hypothetical protein [Thermoproteota archaeon]